MLVEIILGFVIASVLLVYFYFTMNYNYWARRGIPSLRGTFPFGNIKDVLLMRKTIGEMYDEIYKRFAGCPYVGFYKLCQPALMVRDPELVKTVLIKEFNSFHDNDYHVNPLIDPILGLNPFNAKGDKWKPLRDLVTPSLTVIKVKALVPQIVNVCEELVNYLEREGNQPMEAYELASKYTTDVVGRCAYGVESNSFTNPDNELHQMSKKIFEGSFTSNAAVIFAFYAPKLGEIFKFKIASKEFENFFVGLVQSTVEYRIKNGVTREDYLQSLINANSKAISTSSIKAPLYSYVEMAGHCMTFFLDGFETAAILISFTLFELAANPQVQEKLRHEIQKALTDFRMFKFETIHGLHYLEMVILECLRKHPPGTTTTRLCTKDVEIGGHTDNCPPIKIEAGTPVVLPMYSLHNDPYHFPDPERFDPERFSEENKEKRHPYAHFPFGAGPRSCPGFRFALSMVKMSIISILLDFKVTLRDGKPPEKIELNPMNTFFHTPKNGLWIKFDKLRQN